MNFETIIRDVESGQIKDDDNTVSCKGQTNIVHGEVIDNILVVSQTRIVLKEEQMTISGNEIEVLGDHLRLGCKPSTGGCRTIDRTYVRSEEFANSKSRRRGTTGLMRLPM